MYSLVRFLVPSLRFIFLAFFVAPPVTQFRHSAQFSAFSLIISASSLTQFTNNETFFLFFFFKLFCSFHKKSGQTERIYATKSSLRPRSDRNFANKCLPPDCDRGGTSKRYWTADVVWYARSWEIQYYPWEKYYLACWFQSHGWIWVYFFWGGYKHFMDRCRYSCCGFFDCLFMW